MKTRTLSLALGLALALALAAPGVAPALEIKQGSTALRASVLLVSTTDHTTPVTGATVTVTASKNGAAFAAIAGSVAEVGNGWYNVTLAAADTNTLGDLILHASASGADPADRLVEVVAYDATDPAALGLSRVDAAVSSRLASTSYTAAPTTSQVAAAILATPANLLLTNSSGYVTATNGGGSGGSAPPAGTAVAGSTASVVIVSGLPSGFSYVQQRLYNNRTGEARIITSQSASGGNYTFNLGSGFGEAGPFSAAPSAGVDTFTPIP